MTIKNLRKRKVTAILVSLTFLMTSIGMSPASAHYNDEQGNNKVQICHEGHTIEVAESAVPAHMAHGDTLGACAGNPTDTIAPVISSHADVYMTATLSSGISVNYSLPRATDNQDANVTVNCSPVSGTVFAVGTTTVTCTATDQAGNTATSTFHVIVTLATDNGGGNGTSTDTVAPVISAHSDVYATASTSGGINVTYTLPTATDNVDSSVSVTCSPMSGSLFPIGTTTITCTSTDHAGNTAASTFHVIVTLATDNGGGNGTSTDMTAPVFAVHPDVYASASTSAGVVVNYTNASATDNVDTSLSVMCAPLSGTVFPVGTTTVTCTTSDTAGNAATTTFHVIVTLVSGNGSDTIAPIFSIHPDVNATTSTSTGAIVTYVNATATDNVDTSLIVVCSPASGTLFPVGTTTVSCTTMDNASNTASTTFHVIVVLVGSNGTTTGTTTENNNGTTTGTTTGSTIPVISIGGQSCAASTTVIITGTAATGTVVSLVGGTGSFLATTSASGIWSATVNLSGASSSNPFAITIRDANGNIVSTSTTNVSFDTAAPVITLNGDASMIVFDTNGFTDPGVAVTDNLGGNITASTTGAVDIHTPGTYTLTYSAVDCAGNVTTATRTVTVLAASGGGGGGGGGTTNTGGTGNTVTVTSPGVTGGAIFSTLPLGLGGIGGGGSAFLPASAFTPTLALVPGVPSTGMGGSASQNIALLLSTLGLVALGLALQRKKKVM